MATNHPPTDLSSNPAAIAAFLARYTTILLDCDGVLWSGPHLLPHIPATLALLRALGKRLLFVTNNSTKSRAAYKAKFDALGIPVAAHEIVGSAYSAAAYIARVLALPKHTPKVFVLGEAGIEDELRAENVPFVGGTDPALRRDIADADFAALADGSALDPQVGAVLAGLDFHVNYLKLATALQYLRRGAVFLATNTDSTLPNAGGLFIGAGGVGAPLVAAAGREPLSLGKPSLAMLEAVEGRFELDRATTCMVGDRLNTDIKFGIDGGLGGTLHVLTGVSGREDWEKEGVWPGYVIEGLGGLMCAEKELQEAHGI